MDIDGKKNGIIDVLFRTLLSLVLYFPTQSATGKATRKEKTVLTTACFIVNPRIFFIEFTFISISLFDIDMNVAISGMIIKKEKQKRQKDSF